MSNSKSSKWIQQAYFLGPVVVVYIFVICIPFFLGLYYSFTDWNGISTKVNLVGLKNYLIVFSDPNFGKAFLFTAKFTFTAVILCNVVGFFLAYLLTMPLKSRGWLRTTFFMPNVIGGVLLGFVWQFIFLQSFPAIGTLTDIGFFNMPWLGTEATAFWALIIVGIWQTSGYLMIIYIAGISSISSELIEAAKIDGAKGWQVLRHIILPLTMPAFTICIFVSTLWATKSFDLNFALTQGGPFGSTTPVAMDIYFEAFMNNRYEIGTAKAFVFFLIVATLSIIQVSITKKKEVEM
ncbi:carbohydrate ABC transporter permease [Metabacillus arenae]|uniref:Sugar ABC transporter permease n=1 Tax=Metabacillus arenae TaxID=2771434 RepID=A0A926NG01_9BACI|nr:sugar ABC transporter permease [Metabacillus arenae]MBD1383602.1 sugar ABC transporter permease [Metabacillus arenae]